MPAQAGEEISEFRLLCSGTLYRGKVLGHDWRKSDVCRLVLDGRIVLFNASQPADDYPQELMLRIPVSMVTESTMNAEGVSSVTKFGFPHREVATDLAALLTLLLRRLISVHSQVRILHDSDLSCWLGMQDWPLPVTRAGRIAVWRRRPLGVLTYSDGHQEIDDRSPPPVPVDSTWLKSILSELPDMPDARAIVSCARLYSQGMELIEERADVAYQMFIAAAETLAQAALKGYCPTDDEKVSTKPALLKRAKQLGLTDSDARELCLAATRELSWTSRKFEKCLMQFAAPWIWQKDELYIELEAALPKKENFSEALRFIYRSRSAALHAGEGLAPTAAIGTSPHIPVDAVIAVLSGKMVLPPVTWFERVVQSALCSFIESQRPQLK